MKPLCTFFHTFLLSSFCFAPPTEITLEYVVTERFAANDPSIINETEYSVGMPCNHTCNEILFNVKCDEETKTCTCENNYPVPLVRKTGCVQAIELGEQCMYSESCVANDVYSTCIQIRYNAYCRCIPGYREFSAQRDSKSSCSKDVSRVTQDLPALLIAISGIAVFSTIICFVLKLFVGKVHRRSHRPAVTTRLLSTSEIAQVAASLHRSDRRPTAYSRKGSRGVTVSTSRATAARAAAILLVSCNIRDEELNRKLSAEPSSSSLLQRDHSPRSFSAKQFKRESERRLARNRQQMSDQASPSYLDSQDVEIEQQHSSRDNLSDNDSAREVDQPQNDSQQAVS